MSSPIIPYSDFVSPPTEILDVPPETHFNVTRLTGVVNDFGQAYVEHGIDSAVQRILLAQCFFKGDLLDDHAVMQPMPLSVIDNIGLTFVNGVAGRNFVVSVSYSDDLNPDW